MIAVLSIINGILRLLIPLAVFGVGVFSVFAGGDAALKAMGGLAIFFALVGSIVGIVLISTGVGMLRLQSWARTLGLVFTWVALLSSAVEFAFALTKSGTDWSALGSAALAGIVLWYFYRPEVKSAFAEG